jgi:hypothetical protein
LFGGAEQIFSLKLGLPLREK